jgi:imidazolonepropionase-like amidohydrolase
MLSGREVKAAAVCWQVTKKESLVFPVSHLMKQSFVVLCAACVVSVTSVAASASDQVPGAPQRQPIALVNATVHTVAGPAIERGAVLFEGGIITAVGPDVAPPPNAEVIDLKGQHVYPSLIEAHSQIGLTEISSVRASRDYAEAGELNPNVAAQVSVNPDSELIPVTRANGVLIAVSAPSSGLVSGRASVMQLDGWTYEDMTLKADAAMIVNWPRMTPRSFRGRTESQSEQETARDRDLQLLRDLFADARAYRRARAADPARQRYDIRLAAMAGVLDGEIPLMVAADRARQIQSAVAFAVEQNVRMILFGGHDAPRCAALLKRYDIPVVVSAVHRNPVRRHEDYDASYTLPGRLHDLGIRFCISGSDRSETWNTRNLGHHASTAAAYGLPKEEALKSVTQYPAEILGISQQVGTLEPGKHATLFVCDADPLDTEVQITHAWIQGRAVDLSSRHTDLYEKYREKYRRQAGNR